MGITLDLEERNSVQDEGDNPPPNSDTCESEERNSVQDEGENPPPNSDTGESEPEHNRIFDRPR